MDWYLEPGSPHAPDLRREIAAHLGRHAEPEGDLWAAELVASELITNALEHAAGPVWVSLQWVGPEPDLTVHDLGSGFSLEAVDLPAPESGRGRGLFLASSLSRELSVAAKRAGGTSVTARLPVRRREEARHDPPRRRWNVLPALAEADASGAFGSMSFLRALVVQLAAVVEDRDGPAGAQAAVAQVGADVGGQMEEAYRAARHLEGRLSPEEMSALYVHLKAAINGDFYVIEATPERIVLGNRRCPFGEAVRHAPSLCRMTSSVFGGIGARNADVALVRLEERIAVGDPECRVVVWLGDAARRQPPGWGHLYEAANAAGHPPSGPVGGEEGPADATRPETREAG